MTVQRFRLVKGWIDDTGRIRTWKLVDETGRIRCEMTDPQLVGPAIEALIEADEVFEKMLRTRCFLKEAISYDPPRYLADEPEGTSAVMPWRPRSRRRATHAQAA